MTFKTAVDNQNSQPVRAFTDNQGETFESSTNPNVDLFFTIGAARNTDVTGLFEKAYQNDLDRALRTVLWARDVRGGAGERETTRKILKYVEATHRDDLMRMLPMIPEVGRWDDLLVFEHPEVYGQVVEMIREALNAGNGLCAKWMKRKGPVAAKLRASLGMTPKQYRKTLVNLTNVVETPMCDNKWDHINYDHVPSVASARYRKAFYRHSPEKYAEYVEGLKKGERNVNASAVFPHDVIKTLLYGYAGNVDTESAVEQWKRLPDFVGDSNILPIVDVSGSMMTGVGGNTSALEVSISLGLYLADKNTGSFSDLVLTFSGDSRFEHLKGDIAQKAKQLRNMHWGMNTDIAKAFENILSLAKDQNVSPSDMPEYLLILSDMEFDHCTRGTAYEHLKGEFHAAGYELPRIVFWNLNGRVGNSPVTVRDENTCLVSGFSPSILKSVLSGKFMTPESIMDEAIMNDRYTIPK